MILPGSWVASGLRHLAGRADNSRVSPLRRAVSTSDVAPACDTNDAPPAITASQGRRPSSFTCDVPRNPVDHGRSNHDSNRAEQALSRVHRPRVAAKVNLDESSRPMALARRAQPDAGPLQGLSHRLGVAAVALGQALTGPAVVVELDGRVEPGGRDVLATESDAGLSELRCRRHPVHGDRGTVACASIRWWPERGRSWSVERSASPGWPLQRALERASDQRMVAATSQDLLGAALLEGPHAACGMTSWA